MLYKDLAWSADIRLNCPLTYTHASADFGIILFFSGTTIGVNRVYKNYLNDDKKEVPGTYVVDIVG